MSSEKIRNVAYASVAILGAGALLYLFIKYIFALVLPFLIAWGVAFAVREPARRLERIIKIPQRLLRLALTILFTLGIIFLLGAGIFSLSSEVVKFFSGEGVIGFDEVLSNITSVGGVFGEIFAEVGDVIKNAAQELLSSLLTSFGKVVSVWVGALPRIFLTVIITVISSLYFAYDLEKVNSTLRRFLPDSVYKACRKFKRGAVSVGFRYLRSYSLLMLITFFVMLLGFIILGVPYALLLALLLAFLDLLPVLGVGVALVPWSIYQLVFGSTGMGIGLIVLYLCHTVIRQFAEPKILGESLGVHPLLTLMLLYVGYSLFGFFGLLLGPVAVVLINVAFEKKNSADVGEGPIGKTHDL